MRSDFAALILTHGRPDRVHTYFALRSAGYTGRILIVIDNEDKTADEYRSRYGNDVVMFDKAAIAKTFDEGDNFQDRRAIIYARNASFNIAKDLGYRFFVQLDDDYTGFYYRFDENGEYGHCTIQSLNWLFHNLCNYLVATPFASIAISQGGDHIGGGESKKVIGAKRKAMNSFICDTEKPFQFVGRINEDVNTYTGEQRKGLLFLTFMQAQLNQKTTQSNSGGMTDLYIDSGTYVKTFYSVMYAPSCVKVSDLSDPKNGHSGHSRIHHKISWNNASPRIIPQIFKKSAKLKANK
jgi:hypothetical protein